MVGRLGRGAVVMVGLATMLGGCSGQPSEEGSGGSAPADAVGTPSGGTTDEPSGGSGDSSDPGAAPSGSAGEGSGGSGDATGDPSSSGDDTHGEAPSPSKAPSDLARKVPAGEKPPQFVVISWDGAGETPREKGVSRFRTAADESDAHMTFFLSGPFLATGEEVAETYRPPMHPKGMQHIRPRTAQMVRDTTRELAAAIEAGHELGTHYNGHFCGPQGGADWSVAQWHQEMDEWYRFVERWEGKTPLKGGTALPKGIARKVQGGRTPCLEGPENAQKAAAEDGWTYDSSTVGAVTWPEKANGVWNFPIPSVQVHGSDAMGRRSVLAMDYNWLSAFNTWAPEVPKAERGRVMEKTYEHELEQALEGNRAPLVLGNHLAAWDDGTYLDAMERFTRTQCPREEVHCVSFAELVEFLDAQDPQRLAAWRTVPPGGRGRW